MQYLYLFINEQEDMNRLMNGIYMFHAIHDYEPYVVCSAKTCDSMEDLTKEHKIVDNTGRLGMYRGYKILIDDTLPFGEVRLR